MSGSTSLIHRFRMPHYITSYYFIRHCVLWFSVFLLSAPFFASLAFADSGSQASGALDSVLDARTSAVVHTMVAAGADLPAGTTQLRASIHYYPVDTLTQKVTLHTVTSVPVAAQDGVKGSIFLTWENPPRHVEFTLSERLQMAPAFVSFNATDRFPLSPSAIPSDVARYLVPTAMIDFNDPAIIDLSRKITLGSGSSQEAVWRLADWVRSNVAYNLSTITKDVSQKASWILANRQGVCDELSVAFIALSRAVGIPARFVNGISYSEAGVSGSGSSGAGWVSHAWAEVWTPATGWMPVDETYAQFGWLDASHVRIGDYVDIDESSVDYEWKGPEGAVFSPITINGAIGVTSIVPRPDIGLLLVFDNSSVGPGSALAVAARLSNPTGEWLPVTASLVKAPGFVGDNLKPVLLPPHARRDVYFIVTVPSVQDDGVYSAAIEVALSTGQRAGGSVSFSSGYPVLSLDDALEDVRVMDVEESADQIPELVSRCRAGSLRYDMLDTARISCLHVNVGSSRFVGVSCYGGDCRRLDIEPGSSAAVDFGLVAKISSLERIVTRSVSSSVPSSIPSSVSSSIPFSISSSDKAQVADRTQVNIVPVRVSFTPVFTVAKVDCPESLGYSEDGIIRVFLNSTRPVSGSIVRVEGVGGFEPGDFAGEIDIPIKVSGSMIDPRFSQTLVYATGLLPDSRRVEDFERCHISVTDRPWWSSFWNWLVFR